jgi:hypothetical protein
VVEEVTGFKKAKGAQATVAFKASGAARASPVRVGSFRRPTLGRARGGGMASVDGVAARLMDPNTPLDVGLLDATVNAFYSAASAEQVRCPSVRP